MSENAEIITTLREINAKLDRLGQEMRDVKAKLTAIDRSSVDCADDVYVVRRRLGRMNRRFKTALQELRH